MAIDIWMSNKTDFKILSETIQTISLCHGQSDSLHMPHALPPILQLTMSLISDISSPKVCSVSEFPIHKQSWYHDSVPGFSGETADRYEFRGS